jgi:hypothetical protein
VFIPKLCFMQIKMNEHQEEIISISKGKLTSMLIGSLAFVAIGIAFMLNPEKFISIKARSEEYIFIVGLSSILFFGLCSIFLSFKFFDSKPGLVLKEDGFIDNSSGVAVGFVPWSDIKKISTIEVSKQKIILVHVKNPEEYINKQKSYFKRKMMRLSFRMYNTPISLASNGLKCRFDELLNKLKKGAEENKARKHNNA